MTLFGQGLSLSGLGLGLTFAALGLFILAMQVLKAVFPGQPPVSTEPRPPTNEVSNEVIAAIAIALAHCEALESPPRGSLGAALEAGRGAWWQKPTAQLQPLKREEPTKQ
jgi:Na+-transporting methylmalonyl-CoA/oxaloacetate decarboxylase gamma subunit